MGMGPGKQLDPAGRPGRWQLIFLLLLLGLAGGVRAQTRPFPADRIAEVKSLYNAGHWQAVVQAVPESADEPAELQLYRGLALAHLERWAEAQRAFEAGLARNPRDIRLLEESAGIAYKRNQWPRAKQQLRRALAIEPENSYAANFLASIYLLEDNLEAALKYWNRIGKPRLSDLSFDPQPRLKPILLDRAFEFSLGDQWKQDQFLTTRARLASLDVFTRMRFDLQAQPDGSFHLVFDSVGRPSWTDSYWAGLLSLARGLPYQTVYPEFYNLNRSSLNWLSLFRWDDQKRRIHSEIAAPIGNDPQWRYRVYFEGRNENWDLTNTFLPATPSPAGLNLEKAEVGAEIESIPNGRWRWSTGMVYAYRRLRNLHGLPPQAAAFFTNGSSLAYEAVVEHPLLRIPERRFVLDADGSAQIGTFFTRPLGRYSILQGGLRATWFPRASGDDYETLARLRAGRTFGAVPFDELFVLGFDRDTDLWMRGHPGLRNGEKGNSPLGRNYLLANWEIAKTAYSGGFLQVRIGPFVDTGRTYDPSGYFGSANWLCDVGIQARIRILGSVEFVLGYGKDLRSGNNSFFSTVLDSTYDQR